MFDIERWRSMIVEHLADSLPPDSDVANICAEILWPQAQALREKDGSSVGNLFVWLAVDDATRLVNAMPAWQSLEDATSYIEQSAAQNLFYDPLPTILRKLRSGILGQRPLSDQEAGNGAIVNGNVDTGGGDFVGRNLIKIYQGQYQGEIPKTPQQAFAIYRSFLQHQYAEIPLQAFLEQSSDVSEVYPRLRLNKIYIPLNTTDERNPQEIARALEHGASIRAAKPEAIVDWPSGKYSPSRLVTAIEAAILYRKLVLIGEPGAGKTTFIHNLIYNLAAQDWRSFANWPLSERDLIPVLVTLRDFAHWLIGLPAEKPQGVRALLEYIKYDLSIRALDFFALHLGSAFDNGKAILFLDGLDEIPADTSTFKQILKIINQFASRYPGVRMVVTCRTLFYRGSSEDLPLHDWNEFELALLDDEHIRQFVKDWFEQVSVARNKPRGTYERLEEGLLKDIFERRDLRRLASNPLLLTVMVIVHMSDGESPGARAKLYNRATDILLWHWEQEKRKEYDDMPTLKQLLVEAGRDRSDLQIRLTKLAFEAHELMAVRGGSDEVGVISEKALLDELRQLHPKRSLDWAEKIILEIQMRTGLLSRQVGGGFVFTHRTFQEYFAGIHLARQKNFASKALDYAAEDAWRAVVLLATGHLVYLIQEYEKPYLLLDLLCPQQKDVQAIDGQRVWLAGEILLEMGVERLRDQRNGAYLVDRIHQQLAILLEEGRFRLQERAKVADILGQLGDPRFDPKTCFLPGRFHNAPERFLGFIHIPAGEFMMGSCHDGNSYAWSDECPEHPLSLSEYWIARYAVTNAQYRCFLEAGGYSLHQYWLPAGISWLKGGDADLGLVGSFVDKDTVLQWICKRTKEKRSQPFFWDDPLRNLPTQPVVGVTWHEAMAYCAWLEEKLVVIARERLKHTSQDDATGFWTRLAEAQLHVCLPSEAEWEKAARGILKEVPYSRKKFANVGGVIKNVCAVGCFPESASPYGAMDMIGNVWEWTRSRWGSDPTYPDYRYPYQNLDGRESLYEDDLRVLRGGSWKDFPARARATFRNWNFPPNFNVDLGFRIILSAQNHRGG